MTFGEWLKGQREARGWSQTHLAQQIGVTPQAINQLEQGKNKRPSSKAIAALARVFGLSLDDVYVAAGLAGAQPADDLPGLLARARALGIDAALLAAIEYSAQDATPERRRQLVEGVRREVARREAQRQQQDDDPPIGAYASPPPAGCGEWTDTGYTALARVDARPLGVCERDVGYST